jgi:hypothetical protein
VLQLLPNVGYQKQLLQHTCLWVSKKLEKFRTTVNKSQFINTSPFC